MPKQTLLIPHTNINCLYPIMAGVSALMQATRYWIKERTVFESKMEPAHFNTDHLACKSENDLANKHKLYSTTGHGLEFLLLLANLAAINIR